MELIRFASAQAFLARCEPWLLRAELEHSVVLSVAHALARDDHPFKPPIFMACVEEDGEVVGCALRPPPDGLTLTRMPLTAAVALASELSELYDDFPDVSGPEREATAFAGKWAEESGGAASLAARMRWYAAERVDEPAVPARGALRLAESEDLAWLVSWASQYAVEVRTSVDVAAFFARRVATRSMYVWEDGEPRSVVAVSGITPNSARISAVFTPPEYRNHGYASIAVAVVTQAALQSGRRWCVLSADLANPQANAIYRRIGYQPTCDAVAITFDSAAHPPRDRCRAS